MQFVPFIFVTLAVVLGVLYRFNYAKLKLYKNLHKPLWSNLTKIGSLAHHFKKLDKLTRSVVFNDFKIVYAQLLHEYLWNMQKLNLGYGKFYFEELMAYTVWRYKTDKNLTRQECKQLYYVYLREYQKVDVQKISLMIEEDNKEDRSIELCQNYESIRKAMDFVLVTEEIKGDFAIFNLTLAFSLETKIKNAIRNGCLVKTDFSNDCLAKMIQDEFINPELRKELKEIAEEKTKK
jgi:hypothetical protein